MVIAAVGKKQVRSVAGPARLTGDRTPAEFIQQWHQLGDIVAVTAGERDGQWDPARVDQQVVLGACAGAINRRGPGQEPPKRARTWDPSTAARDQSICPAAFNSTSSR